MDISKASTFIYSAEANTQESIQSRVTFKKKRRAYTHQVAHTSLQNILSLFKFTKKKRKKYNRINTFLIHAIVRSQYQQGPLGATTMQSNRKAETRMNAVTPHPVDLIYLKYME